jgi:hypothetical protein
LQDALESAIKQQPEGEPGESLEKHAFAVVDLTADPDRRDKDNIPYGPMRPAYAGWNDTEQRDIASLAKLLPLYGAFRMRDDLGALAHASNMDNITNLAANGRTDYRQRRMSLGNRPRIERMFTVDSSSNVEFALQDIDDTGHKTDDPRLVDVHQGWPTRFERILPCEKGGCPSPTAGDPCPGRTRKLDTDAALDAELQAIKFRELLRLMAGWSDNVAAAVVIRALGFPYLWTLTNASGLYRSSWQPKMQEDAEKSGRGGLFLAKNYSCSRWQPPEAVPPEAPPPEDWQKMKLASSGNAQSIATLLTMLGQDRLFTNPASHFGMREMLRKSKEFGEGLRKHGEECPIGMGLNAAYGEPALVWTADQLPWAPELDQDLFTPNTPLAVSKIGLLGSTSVSNALLVRTKRLQRSAGTDITVTFVLVGLCNGTDQKALLVDFGRRIAPKLDKLHKTGK